MIASKWATSQAADFAVAPDLGLDLGDGFEAGKARFAGKTAIGDEPIDIVADGMTADFDAAAANVAQRPGAESS
jgi:hypothetical protein